MSSLFSQTRRKTNGTGEVAGHDLLVRGGFVRQHAAGIFSYLPLGLRVLRKIEAIIRSEIDAIGGQELLMPVVNTADLWKESGRWQSIDAELGRFLDRADREMVLAMTHEEAASDLVRMEIHSYRQLPCLIYHFQTKWRDDPRPRAGLIRVREFIMKDSYSLDRDAEGMRKQYDAHLSAYHTIFRRCGVPATAVEADAGMMGGSGSHEFMYITEIGEDTVLQCDGCGYAANRQIARFDKRTGTRPDAAGEVTASAGVQPGVPSGANSDVGAREKIHTPGAATIEALAAFLNLPETRLAKAVFKWADIPARGEGSEALVVAMIRGDLEVNEAKLATALGARSLVPATPEQIRAHGMEPGYGSPIGARNVIVVVDDTVPPIDGMVTGANEPDYHFTGVRYGRDFSADVVSDIALAGDGSACPVCGGPMTASRGVEIGNIFQLGTKYSEALGCTFLDEKGERQPVYMGSYGIGLGRLMACIAEEHHDERGLMWPRAVTPFQVYLVDLCSDPVRAERLYEELQQSGIEVLYDDRAERAGVKFNDADLIGCSIRLTIGERSLAAGGVEMKPREAEESRTVALEAVVGAVSEALRASVR